MRSEEAQERKSKEGRHYLTSLLLSFFAPELSLTIHIRRIP